MTKLYRRHILGINILNILQLSNLSCIIKRSLNKLGSREGGKGPGALCLET